MKEEYNSSNQDFLGTSSCEKVQKKLKYFIFWVCIIVSSYCVLKTLVMYSSAEWSLLWHRYLIILNCDLIINTQQIKFCFKNISKSWHILKYFVFSSSFKVLCKIFFSSKLLLLLFYFCFLGKHSCLFLQEFS